MSAGNLPLPGEDAPPPPYSETDIYSNSGRDSNRDARSPTVASPHSPLDDSISRMSSSTNEVIYTPPDTPISQHSSPAAFYFDSRPAPPLPSSPRATLVRRVDVRGGSLSEDIPYEAEWAARDVSAQDWATFVNFLLPDHIARGNDAVVERKLRAEADISETASASEQSHAEAQLGQIRSVPSEQDAADAARRRRDAERTVQQWNDNFFGPRGVMVQLDPAVEQARMPGAWDRAFDRNIAQGDAGPSTQPSRRQQHSWNKNFGQFIVNDDGVRYGDHFEANSDGVRIGGLVVDQDGIRMHGRLGPGRGGPGRGGPGRGPPRYGHHHHVHSASAGPVRHVHIEEDRGRDHDVKVGGRDRSASRSSESSGTSDSSESSIGSLPDYDDVHDDQLPLYISRLQDWAAQPEKLRSKEDIRQLRAELRATRQDNQTAPVDGPALRAQLKALRQQWRQVKKQQRRVRREHKRERRQRRRAEKRERRQNRREVKQAEREHRREHKRGRRVPVEPVPPVQPVAPIPPVPPMPFARPAQAARAVPGCHTGRQDGLFGAGGPFGQDGFFGPRGPLGQHGPLGPNGPLGPRGPLGPVGPLGPRGSLGAGIPFGGRGSCGPRGFFGSRSHRDQPAPGYPTDATTRAPGAWPEDAKDALPQEEGVSLPPPGSTSAEKYRTAALVEDDMARRVTAAADLPDGADRRAAEKEIEALADTLDGVMLEADEAYARELAAGGH